MTTYAHIPELFFHYLWKHKLLKSELFSRNGRKICILNPGYHNHDSGPDFSFARVKIGDTIWAGSIEIHKRSSDWYRHQHHRNPAYNNVILHVVAEDDQEVIMQKGRKLETLCVHGKFDDHLLSKYREILHNLQWIPCERLIGSVHPIRKRSVIHAKAIERLNMKTDSIKELLITLKGDWEECCFRVISQQFGAKINIENFDMLARSVPVRVLMANFSDAFKLEAILFGQSGLLTNRLRGEYPRSLKKEHAYLSAKYGLQAMPGYLWKFLRLRPASFPTLRIGHLAALYHKKQSIFTEIIEAEDIEVISGLFGLSASKYWDKHYTFDKISRKSVKHFGSQAKQLLLINAIIPLLHLYGHEMNKPLISERAISFLETIQAEKNAITRKWTSIGLQPENSLESQGLLQLKKTFCDNKRCLDCAIGHYLLNRH